MAILRIAVPSNAPGGLEASRSDHFGHCDLFTLVDIENGQVAAVETVNNIAHEAGGCMAPVGLLQEKGIHAIVVGGMGARPLNGFASVGIQVYFAAQHAFGSVQAVVEGMMRNELVIMQPTQACQGHGNCHH
ncbi:MAG TPA: NifB/NifX family molybdenum-iron cluster-binding protein [Desulfurivibrionaceae bacterium]|nr:NifB/NifX family molybdenum-iron cluster-binding protein [Desulfurivibrionaceae bacterium]